MDKVAYEKMLGRIADRSQDVRATAQELLNCWSFDLEARRPGVAYVTEDGTQVTNLDMACVLQKLVEWGSVIDLSTYQALGPATKREGQIVTSKDHRHGKIIGLIAHSEVLNFSFRLIDMNVMTAKSVGDYRNFLLMHDRKWHEGFHSLTFMPTEMEKELLAKIPSNGNTTVFEHFISPNRWPSIYGRYYTLAKVLIPRLKDEIKFVKSEVKRLIKALSIPTEPWPKTTKGASAPKKVWKFEAEIAGAKELHGDYTAFPTTQEGYEDAKNISSRLTGLKEQLSFQLRATEFSFFEKILAKCNMDDEALIAWQGDGTSSDFIPKAAWVKDREWVTWRQSSRHNPYMSFSIDPENSLHLRWKVGKKTIQVAPDQV